MTAFAGEIECDVREGGLRDVILFSVGANAAHGSRRADQDKRRAITMAPELPVGPHFVGTIVPLVGFARMTGQGPRISPEPKITVLFAEDDEIVRLVGVDVLKDAGFDVIEAANADDALETFRQRRDVGVLLTDIEMPGLLDGLELARRVHHERPAVVIVVVSGRRRPEPAMFPASAVFLAKPFHYDQVVEIIRSRTEQDIAC